VLQEVPESTIFTELISKAASCKTIVPVIFVAAAFPKILSVCEIKIAEETNIIATITDA